ncbi:tripartite tricarboxylate transporter substrate binding protein [Rhodovarius crocodyli]|uniref:Tripartite tricarboxylate transporter substrate binding protein n=1 Tax=Rhodovarius crocodyli TaxID=1979269 RepID=A0A437MM60_9PROT|nr:tripartite tricarboxylate transporter substrate binding protein [Rhodovarius crocodyli]RVT98748.1 tripartite tricarboxylate transporter substrate binding protein [Rhodovarius crocodyli]
MNTTRRALAGLLAAPALAPAFAAAQAPYPTRPIRFVIPWAPGGLNDLVARFINERVGQRLGQNIVNDFKPGAGSRIGVGEIVRAAPDGYTIGMGNLGPLTIFPNLDRNPQYNVLRDIAPICMFAASPLVLVVNKDLPVNNVAELIAYTRSRPGGLNYGSVGVGTAQHLLFEMMGTGRNLSMTHVPYRGVSDSMVAIMSNDVQAFFDALPSMLSPIRQGQVKPIAVTTPERVPHLPDVPTMKEQGIDIEVVTWYGLIAPKATPDAIQSRLYDAYTGVGREPATQTFLAEQGLIFLENAPGEFARRMGPETERWGKIIRDHNITLD